MITSIHGGDKYPFNGAVDWSHPSSVASFSQRMAREYPTDSPTLDSRSSADLSESQN